MEGGAQAPLAPPGYATDCTFATLSVPLQVVASECKQYSTMHLIPYLKHYRNELPSKFTQHENINHLINRQ